MTGTVTASDAARRSATIAYVLLERTIDHLEELGRLIGEPTLDRDALTARLDDALQLALLAFHELDPPAPHRQPASSGAWSTTTPA
jgi:hypothetical protein